MIEEVVRGRIITVVRNHHTPPQVLSNIQTPHGAGEGGSSASVQGKGQDQAVGRKAPKIDKDRGRLRWAEQSALELHNTWRGLLGFIPTFCTFQTKRLRVLRLQLPLRRVTDADVLQGVQAAWPGVDGLEERLCRAGAVIYEVPEGKSGKEGVLLVRGADGRWVGVEEVQKDNKAPMLAHAFAHAHVHKVKHVSAGMLCGEEVSFFE